MDKSNLGRKPLPAVPKAQKLSGINFVWAGISPVSSPRGNDRGQETGSGENSPAPFLPCAQTRPGGGPPQPGPGPLPRP